MLDRDVDIITRANRTGINLRLPLSYRHDARAAQPNIVVMEGYRVDCRPLVVLAPGFGLTYKPVDGVISEMGVLVPTFDQEDCVFESLLSLAA